MQVLTVVYTANLRGDVETLTHLLPRLHTAVQRLKKDGSETRPHSKTLLLDLGGSCAPEVWPCSVTGGRSTLLVLDAMGYDAADVRALSAEDRQKLADVAQIGLVDATHDWARDGIVVTHTPQQVESSQLTILLAPQDHTHLKNGCLYLAGVDHGQFGVVRLDLSGDPAKLQHHDIRNLPPDTPPDPTISGTADFVLSEARLFQQKTDRT